MTFFEVVFIILTCLWLFEFFIFRNRTPQKSSQLERKSFSLILVSVLLAIASSLFFREFDIGIYYNKKVWWTGLVLFGTGVILRYWGILHLKDQFTRDVYVQQGDKLVSSGPYRKLRHPLYSGLFLIVIGFCLGNGSLWSAGFCGALVTIALLHRIRIEEAMLTEIHGERYKDWCRSRYRLIPFVY